MEIRRIAYLVMARENRIQHGLPIRFFAFPTCQTTRHVLSCMPCFYRSESFRVHELLGMSVARLHVRIRSLFAIFSFFLRSIHLPRCLHRSSSRFPSRSHPRVCSPCIWFIFLVHSAAHPPACPWWISTLVFFRSRRCGNAGMVLLVLSVLLLPAHVCLLPFSFPSFVHVR